MSELASEIWPSDQRRAFCYTHRTGGQEKSCNAKEGNPFGPFWDTFDIDFPLSETYGPLHYDIYNTGNLLQNIKLTGFNKCIWSI